MTLQSTDSLNTQPRCAIVGGGVIGLAIAYELSVRGVVTHLFDFAATATQASWAAAGILPTPHCAPGGDPTEILRQVAHREYPHWTAQLARETGIDPEYDRCGGMHVACHRAEAAALRAELAELDRLQAGLVEPITLAQFADREPHVAWQRADPSAIYWLPQEAQVRAPRLLAALRQACKQRGVTIHPQRVRACVPQGNHAVSLEHDAGSICVDRVCLAQGAWTGEFLRDLGIRSGIEPIRGQMVLWRTNTPLLKHVLNEGYRYIVNRRDGFLLSGATIHEHGFDNELRDDDLTELIDFTAQWIPAVRSLPIERTWSGLRAGSRRGRPYLGPIPGFPNMYVATGHYRSGLHLAPVTARIAADLLLDVPPTIDLAPFAVTA